MENIKVSYKQIEEANKEIKNMDIKGKDYAKVSERVKAFRKVYPTGTIETHIEEINDSYVRILAVAKDENNRTIATGRASENKAQKGNMSINLTSMVENCETSAVGRALGFAGFGIDNDIASQEEIENKKQKMFEYAPKMYIPERDAVAIIKLSVVDLMRKMGVRQVELNDLIEEKLWTDLSSLNAHQLLRLENQLKTLNNDSNAWHHLYGQNSKLKNIVPKNTQVTYESAWERFGKFALKQVGTDETKRNEVIDFFLEIGIDLTGSTANENNS